MSDIKKLDQKTIQLIAAGEVIERPASVVKELIENAFDAKAKTVKIEEEEGGKSLIRITDDGKGMSKEDIPLAFMPHATSKLSDISDLSAIHSYGFRGEALASVSAVSKIEIITKDSLSDFGTKADIEEQKVVRLEPVAAKKGTLITVKDLFYNTPVRKKFLKADRSESMAISDVIMKASLSRRDIAVEYYRNGTRIFAAQSTESLKERIFLLQGGETESHLRYFSLEEKDISVEGAVSDNSLYKGNRSGQYLFVNERPVYVSGIFRAAESQYRSLIPHNKFPVLFLYFRVPENSVDINVHPNKKEIRLLRQEEMISLLIHGIRDALYNDIRVRSTTLLKERTSPPEVIYLTENPIREEFDFSKIRAEDFFTEVVEKRETCDYTYLPCEMGVSEAAVEYDNNELSEEETQEAENLSLFSEGKNPIEHLRIIGTVFNSYILLEDNSDSSLVIIDQHAAHERVLYEKFRERFKNRTIPVQLLLVGETLTLSDRDKTLLMNSIETVKRFGFEIEDFGERDIIIRGIPGFLGLPSARDLLLQIVESLDDTGCLSEFRLEKVMKRACVNAIKFGDRIDNEDIGELLLKLHSLNYFETCPHGRPTVVKISKKDFAKVFLRV